MCGTTKAVQGIDPVVTAGGIGRTRIATRRRLLARSGATLTGLALSIGGTMTTMASAQTPDGAIPTADAARLLADRTEIVGVVDGIDLATDAKDWPTCRAYFTDQIYVDFTSLAGGSPGPMPADDLVGAWRTNLYADKPSHHMRTNHRVTVDGDRAEVFSKGYALNILRRETGSDLWEVWGDYTHTLERTPQGWRCSGMTFTVVHARGNELVRTFLPGQ